MGIAIGARFLVDTAVQTFAPFLPLIARGLGVDIVTVGRMLSIQSVTGLLSPLFGVLAERWGYRLMMRLGLLAGGLALLVIGSSQQVWQAMAGMALFGLCLASFLPTLIAYLSARLPYARRARGLGVLEYSWALAGMIGLLLVGQLIAATNWRLPFFVLGVGLLWMALLYGWLPPARLRTHAPVAARLLPPGTPASPFFDLGAGARSAYAAMAAGALNFIAIMQINLSYGTWLSEQYGIDAAGLGRVAFVLGCLDLCASVSVSLFTDRIGKRRSVLIGGAGALLGYLTLPWFNTGLIWAVVALAVTRGFAEFFIVSNISLLTEQAPTQRAKVMTINMACVQIGFMLAAFVGPWLYLHYGMQGLCAISLLAISAASVIMLLWVREGSELEGESAQ